MKAVGNIDIVKYPTKAYTNSFCDLFSKLEEQDQRVKLVVMAEGLLEESLKEEDFKNMFSSALSSARGSVGSFWGTAIYTVPMVGMTNPNDIFAYGGDCGELKEDFPVIYRQATGVATNP